MEKSLNLEEFWEKILDPENQDYEQKVYIIKQFTSKIRREFFRHNFMPMLKDLMKLTRDVEKISITNVINRPGEPIRMIDVSDEITPEVLKAAKEDLKALLIEGNKRWNALMETFDFSPDNNIGTLRVTMPEGSIGLYVQSQIHDNRKLIIFKDIGANSLENWTWDIYNEYDIPKETLKYIIREKVSSIT